MPDFTVTLTAGDEDNGATFTVVHPDGRELVVTVHMPVSYTADKDGEQPVVDPDALVVWLDTTGWEPTPDLLRVNVNDGPIWNYPDEGTQSHGATGADLAGA